MEPISQLASGLLILLLLTSFVKIFTSLGILSYGFGLQGSGFQIVLFAISLALSILVADPMIQRAGGYSTIASKGINSEIESSFRPFLEKNAEDDLEARFAGISKRLDSGQGERAETSNPGEGAPQPAPRPSEDATDTGTPFQALICAFIFSELKEAFHLGLILLIPLLLIDLIVANSLMALGMTQLSSSSLALPLKLLLFFAVDGWALVSDKLLTTYL